MTDIDGLLAPHDEQMRGAGEKAPTPPTIAPVTAPARRSSRAPADGPSW
ncbi:hypothetical protein [Streptomyces atratus]|nr:hypothetical protein [Streptomyces atratus]